MIAIHRNIHRACVAAGLLLAAVGPAAAGPADVTVEVKEGAKPATLTARLHVPAGQGPFAAVIFMHGCGGPGRRQDTWAGELAGEGYVVLDDAGLHAPVRVRDALGGKGATIAYDAAAHADARQRVRAFLARELKGP